MLGSSAPIRRVSTVAGRVGVAAVALLALSRLKRGSLIVETVSVKSAASVLGDEPEIIDYRAFTQVSLGWSDFP